MDIYELDRQIESSRQYQHTSEGFFIVFPVLFLLEGTEAHPEHGFRWAVLIAVSAKIVHFL